MRNKKIISMILTLVIVFTSIPMMGYSLQAKTKVPALSSKKVVIKKGKTKTVKLKNATKKVQWKAVSGRKNVKIVKKSGKYKNKIKLKARRKGSAVLVAVHGKKIYILNVIVKEKGVVVPEPTTKPNEEPTTKPEPTTENQEPEYATITFLGIDKKVVCTMEYQKGKAYGSLPFMYLEQYVFLGWDTEYYGGEVVKESDICQGDATFFAALYKLLPTVEETYEIVE